MGNTSIIASVKFSLLPIAKVLIICGLGFLLATRRIGILSPSANKLLSKLVFTLFLPCLIFTELGSAITLQKMLQWWFIPVNVVIASTVGCIVGCIVVLIIRPPQEFVKFTIIMIGIGNIGNIPLVLISAVCADDSNPFGDSATCSTNGVAYISFGQWVGAVVVYTFVYYMLSPPQEMTGSNGISASHSVTVKLLDDVENSTQEIDSTSENASFWKEKMMQVAHIAKALRLKQIFQPPVAVSILTLVFGATPVLKKLFLVDNAPLSFLTESLSLLGDAMIPCILLALGGNLQGGPGTSKLGLRTTMAITITRLFVIPPIGIGVVSLADKLGFLPENNELFRFVLLLQHTMPSSILAGAVAALRGVAEKEAAAVLFWEHIVAVASIAIWLIVYLNIIF